MARSLLSLSLAALAFVSLGACSSSSADDGATASDDVIGGASSPICSTLDYAHERTNDDYFQRFADDASAIAYATPFLAAIGKPPAKEISKDPRLLRLVDEVYRGFRQVFPRETAGLETPPQIVVVQSDDINAFAGFDDRPEVMKAPWLFFVHTSILEQSLEDSQLRGLFVHELAHLILRNVLPETRAKIRVHYRAPAQGPYTIGAIASDDAALRAHAEELRRIGDKVGRFPVMGPFPLGLFSTTEYQGFLGFFRSQRAATTDASACAASDEALAAINAIVQAHGSAETYTLPLSAAEKEKLDRSVAQAKRAIGACYAHVQMSLLEVKVRANVAGATEEELQPLLAKVLDPSTPEHAQAVAQLLSDPIERELDQKKGLSAIERVLGVVERLHADAAKLEADTSIPIDELRVFDMEEDADDAAVRVLRAIGDDPLGNGRFLLSMLKDPESCVREVESGKEPTYGRFVDPHNGTCWRYHHSVQLAKALEGCGGTPAKPRVASGVGIISPADKPATQLLEKGFVVRRNVQR